MVSTTIALLPIRLFLINMKSRNNCQWIVMVLTALFTLSAVPASAYDVEEGGEWWYYPKSVTGKVAKVNKYDLNERVDMCLRVADSLVYSQVDSISFYCHDPHYMQKVTLWASNSLSNSNQEYIFQFDVTDVQAGFNRVALPTPVTIGTGYTFFGMSVDAGDTLLIARYTKVVDRAFYMRSNKLTDGKWANVYKTYGTLPLELHVKKAILPSASLSIASLGELKANAASTTNFNVTFRNLGSKPVSTFSYEVSFNGELLNTQNVNLASSPLAKGAYRTQSIQVTVPDVQVCADYEVKVTKVNGEENASEHAAGKGAALILQESMPKKVVVEDFTGIWCGYCPRGIVAMENFAKLYPEQFIGIAAHYNDIISSADYLEYIGYNVNGFPIGFFDRTVKDADLYFGYATNYPVHFQGEVPFKKALAIRSEAQPKLQATWTDEERTAIRAEVKTSFLFDRDNCPYRYAFVLTEDGMSGTTADWMQSNYYGGMTAQYPDDDMKRFTEGGSKIMMSYDDVAVQGWELYRGIANSVSASVKKDVADEYVTTLDISENQLIQNKDNLKLVVMLLNTDTGCIVNADEVSIVPDPTGIEGIRDNGNSDAHEVARYNLNGVRMAAPAKGMQIVKMSDGRVVKVMK